MPTALLERVRACVHSLLPDYMLIGALRSQHASVPSMSDSAPSNSRTRILVLKRVYGPEQITTNYSNTISSVAFAGTVVGMLVFGYLSDKLGRKFGMVRTASISRLRTELTRA